MSKKKDDFGTIKLTQEELLGKMVPKKAVPPSPRPPASTQELPALKPPVPPPPSKETPALQPPPTSSSQEQPAAKPPSGTTPAVKPGAKPGKSVLDKKAADVCKLAPLDDEAKPLLTPDITVQALVQALVENKLLIDAVKVLAFALPKREVVGWGLHCVKQVYKGTVPRPVAVVFQIAQLWLADPNNENHRRAAHDAAEAAEIGSPAGCLGMAVFFSGGSMAPPTAPVVAPMPHLTHQMVANALQLAAVMAEPEKADEKWTAYIGDGLKLAALVPDAPAPSAAPAKPGAA